MAGYEKDEVPMLDGHQQLSDENMDSKFPVGISRTRSASISIPMNSVESYEGEANLVGYTGPLRSQRRTPMIQMSGPIYANRNTDSILQITQGGKAKKLTETKVEKVTSFSGMDQHNWMDDQYAGKNENLLRSGQLGVCNDPYCTTCPMYYKVKQVPKKHSRTSIIFDSSFHNALYGDAKGWAKRLESSINPYIPGVMNPHTRFVQLWNKFFVISCLVAIFVDPLFFFLLSVEKEHKCIVIDWRMTTTIVVFRSMTDFIYLLNMLLQFRLAYIAPESRVIGTGELVDDPKKIARRYLRGCFALDSFIVLPLPQIIVLMILRRRSAISGANTAKNLLRLAVLVQYIPRLYRFLPLLVGVSPTGFIFENAWANFIINLLTFMLSGHVVGSCWYLFGLQRVNQCLRNACRDSVLKNVCMDFIDCGHRRTDYENPDYLQENRTSWKQNKNATACFADGFPYGIYVQAVNLTTQPSVGTRYIYSLFWGFQQISTLAGNQVPSYFVWEVLFTMAIVGLGLLLFAFLIGNIQNFLQALGRRRLEMSLRRRDVEQWISHRRLPQELRRKILEAERYNWAATRGINEEVLMENLPEDLQRDIRRHFFKFIKNVWIFALMDDNVLDAICERLKQSIYIAGSEILFQGGLVEKMVFIVRGKIESIGENGTKSDEGNVCGEELLTWCLENSSVNKDGKKIKANGQKLISSRTVRCLTNVEAFSLRAADLEEVTNIFARNLRNPRIQGAIRYESLYWRGRAAQCIQVAWRYRQKRLKRTNTAKSN